MDRGVTLAVVLALHVVVALGHGVTHTLVGVWLTPWTNVLVVVTTYVFPVVGVALVWRGEARGALVFAGSLAGAFVLGGALHFVLETPDHVAAIPASQWGGPFRATAAAVLLTPAIGAVAGVAYWLDVHEP